MNRLISIVVPVYNKAPYLAECFDSLLAQTYPEVEIVAVDDGSTDESVTICKKYCKENENFLFLQQKNAGQNAARKTGVDAAVGDWIIFVDADDLVSTDMCAVLMKSMEENDVDFVGGSSCHIYPGNKLSPAIEFPEGIYSGRDCLRNGYADKGSLVLRSSNHFPGSLCATLYRKAQIQDVLNHFDMSVRFGEDTAALWMLMMRAKRISYIPTVVYYSRHVEGSVSRSYLCNTTPQKLCRFANYLDEEFRKAGMLPEDHNIIDAMCLACLLGQGCEYFDDFPGIFPYFEGALPPRVMTYGFGDYGRGFYLKEKERLNIVGCYDRNFESYQEQGFDIQSPELLEAGKDDCILITVWRESTAKEIRNELVQRLPKGTKIFTMSKELLESNYARRKVKDLRSVL